MVKRLLMAAVLLCAVFAHAQTAQPIIQPHVYFVNGSGAPCAGCSLFSYQAGTTTAQATYTSASGLTVNTNPIILDATGSANIWMGSLSYKFVLIDTFGTTLWTVDQVLAPLGGASGPYLPLAGGALTGVLAAPYFQFTTSANTCGAGTYVYGWAIAGWQCATPLASGSANGDLSGTYPSPKVVGINGLTVPANTTLFGTNSLGQLVAQAGTITNNTTGNAATATALFAAGTNCGLGNTSYGISANGNALCNVGGTQVTQSLIITGTGTCTTGAGAYSQCTGVSQSWPIAFADTGYGVSCSGVGAMTGTITQIWVSVKTTTAITLSYQNGTAAGAVASSFAEVDCVSKHP